jgi:hypothetical protein
MSSNVVARRSQPKNARTCPSDVEHRCTGRNVLQSHEQSSAVLRGSTYGGVCQELTGALLMAADLLGELNELGLTGKF